MARKKASPTRRRPRESARRARERLQDVVAIDGEAPRRHRRPARDEPSGTAASRASRAAAKADCNSGQAAHALMWRCEQPAAVAGRVCALRLGERAGQPGTSLSHSIRVGRRRFGRSPARRASRPGRRPAGHGRRSGAASPSSSSPSAWPARWISPTCSTGKASR